jgi:hypothetical protein
MGVFISYAHGDTSEQIVRDLTTLLRRADVEVRVDADEASPTGPDGGWIAWMRRQIEEAQWVLLVFDENYRKAWDGEGSADAFHGSAFEARQIVGDLYEKNCLNDKYIPLILETSKGALIPREFSGSNRYVIPAEAQTLCQRLRNDPRTVLAPPKRRVDINRLQRAATPELVDRASFTRTLNQALADDRIGVKGATKRADMADIFISYARGDRPHAERLAQAFQADGFTVWWDLEDLASGQSFNRAIQAALESAQRVVVLWSDTSIKSDYVEAEAYWAWQKKKLHSVQLEHEMQVPVPFNTSHARNLAGWDGTAGFPEFRRLVADVARVLGSPTPATPPEPPPRPKPRTQGLEKAPTVFLCHDSNDQDIVADLEEDLHRFGVQTWRDKNQLRGGMEWEAHIPLVIRRQVDYFLVCETPNLLGAARKYFHAEIKEAKKVADEFGEGQRFIIPATLVPSKAQSGAGLASLDKFHRIRLTTEQERKVFSADLLEDWSYNRNRDVQKGRQGD